MKIINLQPFDVIIVSSKGWVSYLIKWRSLSQWSHSFIVSSDVDTVYDITAEGVHLSDFTHYKDNHIAVCRYKDLYDYSDIRNWCDITMKKSKGYDFKGFLGFVLFKPSTEDETRWFCSEFVYNAFQVNGYKLTNQHTKFPYPSLFYRNIKFEVVAEGVLDKDFILR